MVQTSHGIYALLVTVLLPCPHKEWAMAFFYSTKLLMAATVVASGHA
jgi:hypothetical protein